MAAALGGLDALVFTGGVGERVGAGARGGRATGSASSGSRSTQTRNDAADGDADVSADGAPVRTLVVPAREDLEIARQVRALLR